MAVASSGAEGYRVRDALHSLVAWSELLLILRFKNTLCDRLFLELRPFINSELDF
jgi:hypothetical protein